MTHRIAVIGTGTGKSGKSDAPAEIAAVAGAGFAPGLVETRYGGFPGTPYDRGLGAIGYIEAGIAAAADGADGVFINTFGDYGIAELRSAVSIPVVGAGEAAMAVAATLGRRFAIVTIWPKTLGFIYDERLAACRMESRCVDVSFVLDAAEMGGRNRDADPVTRMRAGKADMIERIVAAGHAAIARGADTVILGCTCMAPIAAKIAALMPVPVVDPATTGYKFTEMLVGLSLTQSAVAFPRAASERLAAIGNLVDGRVDEPAAEAECEVCVIAAE